MENTKVRQYGIIGAPQTKAAGPENTGVAELPTLLRDAGILDVMKCCDAEVEDFGDAFPSDVLLDYDTDEYAKSQDHEGKYLPYRYVKNCELIGTNCQALYKLVTNVLEKGKIPLVIGGDHGIATGSIAASLQKYPDLLVIFVDAHTDINTPDTTVHGNYHGMPLANLSGLVKVKGFEWMDNLVKLDPRNIGYFGIRFLYQVDKDLIDKLNATYYTMDEIIYQGAGKAFENFLNDLDPTGKKPIHLSFDMDGCDHTVAPGTLANVEGGLSYAETLFLVSFLNKTGRMVSMDIVEVNSDLDVPTTVKFQTRLPIKTDLKATERLALNILVHTVMGSKGIQTKRNFVKLSS